MQIQGSGRVKLTDGTTIRVHYDGKNGHPYSSIGRYLIDKGLLAADKVSMGALAKWLKADPERGKQVMWQNASYVFFRELKGAEAGRAAGRDARSPLTPGRSLAVDPSYHCARPADLRQCADHEACAQDRAVQSADGRAGRRLGHQGPRARRHLLRLRRCGWPRSRASPSTRASSSCCCPMPSRPRRSRRPGSGDGESPAMSRTGRSRAVAAAASPRTKPSSGKHATRTLDPVKAKPRVLSGSTPAAAVPARAAAAPAKTTPPATPAVPNRPAPQTPRPAPLADFDRRKARQIASGKRGRRPHRSARIAPARRPRTLARLPACAPRPRARPCWSSPARVVSEPAILWPTPWASASAASCGVACRIGWRSPTCALSCSATRRRRPPWRRRRPLRAVAQGEARCVGSIAAPSAVKSSKG